MTTICVCRVVINELLTFVQNKVDVLDEVSIIQICSTGFQEDEIESAKCLIVDLVPGRRVTRKGDGKTTKTLQDIIKIMKETDPDQLPTFVARDLNKLPPVTFDHIDVTRFLKDLTLLKAEMTEKATIAETNALKLELSQIKETISQITQQRTKVNNPPSKMVNSFIDSPNILNENNASHDKSQLSMHNGTKPKPKPPQSTCHQGASKQSAPSTYSTYATSKRTRGKAETADRERTHHNNNNSVGRNTDDDFTLVVNKRKMRNVNKRGTGSNVGNLRIANLAVGLYVSRFAPETSTEDVKSYIENKGLTTVNIEILKPFKETPFKTFKIMIQQSDIQTVMNNDFWPQGTVFRRFREAAVRIMKETNQNG